MKIKCFWEKIDVISGMRVRKANREDEPAKTAGFMIVSRGFSTGEAEYNLLDLDTGELTMNTFMNRKGMAEHLTQIDFEPMLELIEGETAKGLQGDFDPGIEVTRKQA